MRKLLIVILIFCSSDLFAQGKQFIYGNQIWYGYYPQIRFTKHWGLWNDWELHSKEDFTRGVSQIIFRLAATYYTNDNTKLTAGYGYSNNYPGDNHLYISQPEHHFWEQVQWYSYFRKKKLMQWIRLEERYRKHVLDNYTIANYYDFNYRARYEAYYQLPLSKKGLTAHHFAIGLGEEVYINFGKTVSNYFDQNRLSASISYMANNNDNLVLGYTNLFQQAGVNVFKKLNLIRLSYFQNIETGHSKIKTVPHESGM